MAPPSMIDDQANRATLIAVQMEALCIKRRDILSTTDFKENKACYIPTKELESRRLINKGRIGEGEARKLKGWNNAWTSLQDDGADSQNLRDVNEGLGQTHRARLMCDDGVRDHASESITRTRDCGGRSGREDNCDRGGGNTRQVIVRDGKGKVKGKRTFASQAILHQQPITRVRVPKRSGKGVTHSQPTPVLTAVSAVKGNSGIQKVAAIPTQRPIYDRELATPNAFMASMNVGKQQRRDGPSAEIIHTLSNNLEKKAAGFNMDTSTSSIDSTTSFFERKARASSSNGLGTGNASAKTTTAVTKPAAFAGSDLKADLMDLDIGQETMQPVLQFTASSEMQPCHPVAGDAASFDQTIEALEESIRLEATKLNILKGIQAQVHARRNPYTTVKNDPRQNKITGTEIESLRSAGTYPKVTTSIARKFTEQQNAFLIGEHVHKTRYHTAASLTEDFEKLTISDQTPIKLTRTDLSIDTLETNSDKKPHEPASSIYLKTEKSMVNPFSPPHAKNKGPSLPAHLLKQKTTADPSAAARAQYLGGNGVVAPVSIRQSFGDLSVPAYPSRRNRINETGFIALAENSGNVAARKKGEML